LTARQDRQLKLATASPEPNRLLAQGLVALYKAVKGAGFYPPGHHYRNEPLQRAWELLCRLVEQQELVLTVTRQGFTPGAEEAEGRAMVQQLAHECLIRRIATLTLLPDLLLADLAVFVDLLSADPHKTAASGGLAEQLEQSGVRTIWINEKDISAIWAKRGEGGERLGGGGDEEPGAEGVDGWGAAAEEAGRAISELVRLMAEEKDDARYQELGRQLVERFRRAGAKVAVLPVLSELLRQHEEPTRSLAKREYALFTLERLADGGAEALLQALERRECEAREEIHRVLAALGAKAAYWLIPRLCLAEGVFERKALARALVGLGPAAVGPVIDMLKDERWYVVRNMVAILGDLAGPDALFALKRPLYHYDGRVRKETIRALMRISGEAAENMLIALLEDPDEAVVRQTILSLGLMRSRQAVPALLRLLDRRDLLLKGLELKKELLAALGRIGDHRTTPALLKLLVRRGLPVLGRWLELRVAVASALGALGDEKALPALRGFASRNGALGEACREAIDSLERLSGGRP